ncbi:MAG: hypothetical protein IJY08_00060 [Clostridia bacterium]|nr:hypothetical protein [Clostridia bacterium]
MKKYNIAVADMRIGEDIKATLPAYAESVVVLPQFKSLAEPVSAHPDMLMWHVGDSIVTYRSYKDIAAHAFRQLEEAGYRIICEDDPVSHLYPHDVALNCARVGKYLIANQKTVSKKVAELADIHGLSLLHTNQGYAKCSTVTVSDNAIITADESIYRLAAKNGIDALLIRQGEVRLDGYGYGFMGGASGVTDSHVLFTGNLSLHPDASEITAFCLKHGKAPVSLSRQPLYDYGTVMFL